MNQTTLFLHCHYVLLHEQHMLTTMASNEPFVSNKINISIKCISEDLRQLNIIKSIFSPRSDLVEPLVVNLRDLTLTQT